MVKKFEEFVNEGLWGKTFDRARTGEERLGDKVPPLFKEDDVYPIKRYPGYFISQRGGEDEYSWKIYVAPNEEPICEYENLDFVNFVDDDPDAKFIFRKGHEYWEDYTVSDNISDEDYKLMTDDNFIEALYRTLADVLDL